MSKLKITCTAATLRDAKALQETSDLLMQPMGLTLVRVRAAEAASAHTITTTYVEAGDARD